MRQVEISAPGDPSVLRVVESDAPVPGAGEVRIRVAAAGVNRPDVLQRQGHYPPPPGASPIPGLEVAGTIDSLGPGVVAWQPGDRVCALTNGGGYAELCVVPASQCLPVPEPLDFVQAAALPETTFTVWENAFHRGRLAEGECFLVHGGSSGIGTTAIQLARAAGARVFTTAGSDAKCRACVELGAELAINYREQDFVEVVRAATQGRGVDLILDMVGGDYLPRNLDLLAVEGRLVQIAFLKGPRVEVDLRPVMTKRLTLTGSTLRSRTTAEKASIAAHVRCNVWPWIEFGHYRPRIEATFPLDRAADAHRLMESSQHVGKIVLVTP